MRTNTLQAVSVDYVLSPALPLQLKARDGQDLRATAHEEKEGGQFVEMPGPSYKREKIQNLAETNYQGGVRIGKSCPGGQGFFFFEIEFSPGGKTKF